MTPLYPIVDLDTLARHGLHPLRFAERVLKARPSLLQLRAKHQTARETLAWLDQLVPLCREAGTELYANDRPDLALLAGASGVHVGQLDLPIGAVRRFTKDLKIGVSTHTLPELESALAERPDYVALGPIFATRSKLNPEPVVGLETLAVASRLCTEAEVRLVAIGGIEPAHLPRLAELGVTVALISAFFQPESDVAPGEILAPTPEELAARVESRARSFAALLGA